MLFSALWKVGLLINNTICFTHFGDCRHCRLKRRRPRWTWASHTWSGPRRGPGQKAARRVASPPAGADQAVAWHISHWWTDTFATPQHCSSSTLQSVQNSFKYYTHILKQCYWQCTWFQVIDGSKSKQTDTRFVKQVVFILMFWKWPFKRYYKLVNSMNVQLFLYLVLNAKDIFAVFLFEKVQNSVGPIGN